MKSLKEEELKKLGQNIKRLRKARGINQTVLATDAKTRPTTISSIENGGNSNPGWDLLGRIANVLDASIHELTLPEIEIEQLKKDGRREVTPALSDLVYRQEDFLALGESRISMQELEWLKRMPLDSPGSMTAERYLLILRHYRLISKG